MSSNPDGPARRFMEHQVKLSVCIPTYRRPRLLAETLEHLAGLPQLGLEVVVSDNASGDNTREIAEHFKNRLRIRYHCQPENLGMSENLQTAMMLSSGQYVYSFSDDDRLLPEGLTAALRLLDDRPDLSAVFGGFQEWVPGTGGIRDVQFVEQYEEYNRNDKARIFNRFAHLWFPVMRGDIFRRFCFYDDNTFGFWRLTGMLMDHGSVAVLPELFYRHAQTEPRMEYNLTESWYHDKHRSDYELFAADMALDFTQHEQVVNLAQFINGRVSQAYLQGLRFAKIKKQYLTQRHFLLRAKTFGLVATPELVSWEEQYLLHAVAERLHKIAHSLGQVEQVVCEATPLLNHLDNLLRTLYPDWPPALVLSREQLLAHMPQADELVLSQDYTALHERTACHPVLAGREWAAMDLLTALRVTRVPLNLGMSG